MWKILCILTEVLVLTYAKKEKPSGRCWDYQCRLVEDAGTLSGYYYPAGENSICSDGCQYKKKENGKLYCLNSPGLFDTYLEVCREGKKEFKCGVKNKGPRGKDERIIGGQETGNFEYPWLVSLLTRFEGPEGPKLFPTCGGTLIAAEWVLTASHCIRPYDPLKWTLPENRTAPSLVALGEHNFAVAEQPTRKGVKIENVFYNDDFYNDIALIKLVEKVNLNIYTPACLSEPGVIIDYAGQTAHAYGWGMTNASDPRSGSRFPNEVAFPVVTRAECEATLTKTFNETISIGQHELCAGEDNKSTCMGDSGGPLTIADNITEQHTLVGATSWGSRDCGAPGTVSVYSNVGYFREWMQNIFEENGGANFKPVEFKCGVKRSKAGQRLIGGDNTENLEYPWLVNFLEINPQNEIAFSGCAGTLVAAEWVVTAASCVIPFQQNNPFTLPNGTQPPTLVNIGEYNVRVPSQSRMHIPIAGVAQLSGFIANVALVRLAVRVDLYKYTPACLPLPNQPPPVGQTAFAYGWGMYNFSIPALTEVGSHITQDIAIPVVTKEACQSSWDKYNVSIQNYEICAGAEGKGFCYGDQGGPLTVPDPTTGQHVLVGAASRGFSLCAEPGYLGIYSNIAVFRQWIDDVFKNYGATLAP